MPSTKSCFLESRQGYFVISRRLVEEKASSSGQRITGKEPLTPETDLQAPTSPEQPTMDDNGAQVLLLGSRGSTAEAWLAASDSAQSLQDSITYIPAEVPHLGEDPLLPPEAETPPALSFEPSMERDLEVPAAEEVAVKEPATEQALSLVTPRTQEEISHTWDSPGAPEGLAASPDSTVLPDLDLTQDENPDVEEQRAAKVLKASDSNESDLPLDDSDLPLAESEEAETASLVEQVTRDEMQPTQAAQDTNVEKAGQMATEELDATTSDHSEKEIARPRTAISAMEQSLVNDAELEEGSMLEDSLAMEDKSALIEEVVSSDTNDFTLDNLIHQTYRNSYVAADIIKDPVPVADTIISAAYHSDSFSFERPATAVSQTLNELVVSVEAQMKASLDTAHPGSEQEVADLHVPVYSVQEAKPIAAALEVEWAPHNADVTLFGTNGLAWEQHDASIAVVQATLADDGMQLPLGSDLPSARQVITEERGNAVLGNIEPGAAIQMDKIGFQDEDYHDDLDPAAEMAVPDSAKVLSDAKGIASNKAQKDLDLSKKTGAILMQDIDVAVAECIGNLVDYAAAFKMTQ